MLSKLINFVVLWTKSAKLHCESDPVPTLMKLRSHGTYSKLKFNSTSSKLSTNSFLLAKSSSKSYVAKCLFSEEPLYKTEFFTKLTLLRELTISQTKLHLKRSIKLNNIISLQPF